MSTLDPRLEQQLDRLAPATVVTGDWEAVVGGARRRARRRWLFRLAAAAAAGLVALAASPVGGAIAGGVGDFSKWLVGEPGSPAAESDQQAFQRENQRSWAAFPQVTMLRRLITIERGGHSFELFGFRAGSSLCLRLVVHDLNEPPAVSCAPLDALRDAEAPVLVVEADHGFGVAEAPPSEEGYVPPLAQATFGIVADGVEGVRLDADDGSHRATLAANAFLYVADRPKLGARIRRVTALLGNGRRVVVPFQPAAFGESEPPTYGDGRPTGPAVPERRVDGGHIGWIERHELRGEDAPGAFYLSHVLRRVEFSRLLAPDPQSHLRIAIALGEAARTRYQPSGGRTLCTFLIGDGAAGGGCSPYADLFFSLPFTFGETLLRGGDQYTILGGLASDDVARMTLFLASGRTRPIALTDNAWLVQAARADYPVRIVAYDHGGHVIGVQTPPSD